MLKRLLQSFFTPARHAFAQKTDRKIRHWSGKLQQWFLRFNRKRQIVLLGIFCLLTCAGYTLILFQAVSAKRDTFKAFKPFRMPGHTMETGEPPGPQTISSNEAKAATVQFRHYADSLQQSASGKLVLDSLEKQWPGIMDTLVQMEKLYRLK